MYYRKIVCQVGWLSTRIIRRCTVGIFFFNFYSFHVVFRSFVFVRFTKFLSYIVYCYNLELFYAYC